jgi:hypothetical protein
MRTKTLLLTAAIAAVGLAGAVAQSVYSVNAVGYVNLNLSSGFSLISNPLNGTNNNISTVLPAVPDGTQVLKWDSVNQKFFDAEQFFDGIGWIPGTSTLAPGEGAFINITDPTTITFVGEVPQGVLSNSIPVNFSIASMQTPQQLTLTAANFPAVDGDQVLLWDSVNQKYTDAYQFFDGIGWIPEDPALPVGSAFFVNKAAPGVWLRTFSVN